MILPKVSVITPTYNRSKQALRAVQSVLAQDYPNIEHVVIVDGSNDQTVQVLEQFCLELDTSKQGVVRIIESKKNYGVSHARNIGIEISDGDFIATLDDDDSWESNKIRRQMETVRKQVNSELFLCTSDFRERSLEGSLSDPVQCSECVELSGQIRLGIFPPPSTWLFSRAAYISVGGFDTRLHAGEDADFITELRKRHCQFINDPIPLTIYQLSAKDKVYRDQEIAASITLEKHHNWWLSVLSDAELSSILAWYQKVLPAKLYKSTLDKIY